MIPREMLDTQSEEFAKRTIDILTRKWTNIELSIAEWRGYLSEAEQHKVWEPLGFDSLDNLLTASIGHTVGESLDSLRLRNEQVQEAAQRTTGQVLPSDGSVHPANASQFANHTQSQRAKANGVSKRTQEKLDRLAREFPELHEQVKAGIKSCHAACKEAGFVRDPTPLQQIQRIWQKASSRQRREIKAWLRRL